MSDQDGGIEILEIVGLEDDRDDKPAGPSAPAEPEKSGIAAPEIVLRLSHKREEGRMAGIRELLRKLLPPLDDLEQCIRQQPDKQTLEDGVRLTLRSLWDVFRQHDLERIEGDGVPFDPHVHEAAIVTPTSRVPPGIVLETLRVGYQLGGTLARPALVRVSGPSQGGPEEDEEFEAVNDGVGGSEMSPGEESDS